MLKTAVLTLGLCVLGQNALAVETPKYDRKIERAAMERAARKVGALRQTLNVEIKAGTGDAADLPRQLDLEPTAGVLAQPDKSVLPEPVEIKNFTIIAGEYDN